jgi:hypothetical protein
MKLILRNKYLSNINIIFSKLYLDVYFIFLNYLTLFRLILVDDFYQYVNISLFLDKDLNILIYYNTSWK